jgi:hypothetical protein
MTRATIVNQANNTCATVPNGNSAVQLTRSACDSSAGQTFAFNLVSGDVYTTGTMTSGSCLDAVVPLLRGRTTRGSSTRAPCS